MLNAKKIIGIFICLVFFAIAYAQHPNRKKIDSLKQLLPYKQGIERIDCLNALSEEYWWPPRVLPDSISCWAYPAHQHSERRTVGAYQ